MEVWSVSVPSVPHRSRQHFGARSAYRSHRSLPLSGGTVGTLTRLVRVQQMNVNEQVAR